jgi:hypothetical protein
MKTNALWVVAMAMAMVGGCVGGAPVDVSEEALNEQCADGEHDEDCASWATAEYVDDLALPPAAQASVTGAEAMLPVGFEQVDEVSLVACDCDRTAQCDNCWCEPQTECR